MDMILMRGLPGSGKSYAAKEILKNNPPGVIISTDSVFISGDHYLWTPDAIGMAHKINLLKVREACKRDIPLIIVDNTNIRSWERVPYVELAATYRYSVRVVEPDTPWKYDSAICHKKCSHGVPLATIEKMAASLKEK